MIPFLPLIALTPKIKNATQRGDLKKAGLLFVTWAVGGILCIYLFHNYDNPMPVLVFSLLKLAKFCLYCTAGLMISRSLSNKNIHNKYHLSLAVAGAVTGIALASTTAITRALPPAGAIAGFSATNLISVGLAIIFVYIFVLYLRGYGTPMWRKIALVCLVIMLMGTTYSGGRGGWLAALAGLAFAMAHIKVRLRTAMVAALFGLGLLTLYFTQPAFQRQVDRTIFPDQKYLEAYNFGVAGVDDGGRLTAFLNESTKIFNSPIFGAGFYHRGIEAGLRTTGSHNFWLQMFLETGLVGGALILYLVFLMWQHAQRYRKLDPNISLALKCALITAFIGGMSGEYFYGGYGLFALFLVYAPVGSMALVLGPFDSDDA